MTEYRIDELARAVGVTVRNIRAYQDRGLLAPPRIAGRVGLYDEDHLDRLRIISSFLDRGYNTAQIAELLSAWQDGKGLADVIGFEKVASPELLGEEPTTVPTADIRALLGDDTGETLAQIADLGWFEVDGDECVVISPPLLAAVREALDFGFTADEVIGVHDEVMPLMDQVAARMVDRGAGHLIAEHGADWLPSDSELVELTAMLERLRQLVSTTVNAMLARSVQQHVESALNAHVGRVLARRDEEDDEPGDDEVAETA